MRPLNITLHALAAASILTLSSTAHANSANSFFGHTPYKGEQTQHLRLDVIDPPMRGDRLLGSSQTASLYYKKGVSNFEKGNMDKAVQHFKAVLRADGSKGLDKATYHYLTNIKRQQGDLVKAKYYAEAYFNLK